MKTKVYDLKRRTYLYAVEMVKFLDSLPRDYIAQTLGKQLLRSATSVGANVVEAQAASSRRDFTNFYNHALKSANESTFWLELLTDSGKSSNGHTAQLLAETQELSKILSSALLTLRNGH